MEDENTFNILIATDTHLGYLEKDEKRSSDSINSFKEILSIAVERKVDFILLGGDLFHDNTPSRRTLYETINALRRYCMGDNPIGIEILSDQSENFPNEFATVNYEDENLNISIPVFSIHGNHDDPSGPQSLCALDLLSAMGLVNYFGKQTEVDNVVIKPLLLRKGTSSLSIYGLGNIRDERLYQTFRQKKVKMFRPAENTEDWFNLMVLHQNRVPHTAQGHIPEHFIDDFIDLALWGHEHQCRIDPEISQNGVAITQPGSSIATSLSDGEAFEKHVGILKIHGKTYQLEKIRLKTVRPFVMESIVLSNVKNLQKDKESVEHYLKEKIALMIDEGREKWIELNPEKEEHECPLPLIRLRVDYSDGFSTIAPSIFGKNYIDIVANPKDMLLYHRKRVATKKKVAETMDATVEEFLQRADSDEGVVEAMVAYHLQQRKLQILPDNELTDVVTSVVNRQDKDELETYVHDVLKDTKTQIVITADIEDEKKLVDAISKARGERAKKYSESMGETEHKREKLLRDYKSMPTTRVSVSEDGIDDGFDSRVIYVVDQKKGSKRGSSGNLKRKSDSPISKKRTRKPPSNSEDEISSEEEEISVTQIDPIDDDSLEDEPAVKKPKTRKVPAKKAEPKKKITNAKPKDKTRNLRQTTLRTSNAPTGNSRPNPFS